jgi:Flp pilus assembly protein TadG
MPMLKKNKSRGQALVEFALAATLIFFLLAAAVDLGFMFFAVQGLHNAAQEGGTFGSRWLMSNTTTGARTLDASKIRDNVRHESGARGGIGFVNLLDLNNDGTPDVTPGVTIPTSGCTSAICQVNPATGHYVVEDYIQVVMIKDANLNGDPLDDGAAPNYTACTNSGSPNCYIHVVVAFDYRLVFPLSPTFSRQRTLRSAFTMRIRDDMARSGVSSTAPVFATLTPTNTPLPTSTPTPTPCVRVVPSLVGLSAVGTQSPADGAWAAAGFTGAVVRGSSGNYTVASQSLAAGTNALCNSSITVYR